LRRLTLACAGLLACCACILGGGTTPAAAATAAGQSSKAHQAAIAWLGGQIRTYQRAAWDWDRLMGARPVPTKGRELATMSIPAIQKAVRLWRRIATHERVRAQHPPDESAFLCIHRYEGSWTDSGAPYYGGLQMDIGFQATYAPWLLRTKGTADHWTPLEQIWTAEKAVRSRGFWPWPNTARMCGLI
jgi:hypothetical protein